MKSFGAQWNPIEPSGDQTEFPISRKIPLWSSRRQKYQPIARFLKQRVAVGNNDIYPFDYLELQDAPSENSIADITFPSSLELLIFQACI